MNAQSYLKPNVVERIFGRVLASLVGIGLVRGHFYVLEVRGRKSGRTYEVPLDPIEFEGRCYLVCPRGNSNWVAMPASQAKSCSSARCAAAAMPCAKFLPACVRRSSKPISTDSQARCSASSRYRRDRRWKHSMIWRRVIRSSNCSQAARPRTAPQRPRDDNTSRWLESRRHPTAIVCSLSCNKGQLGFMTKSRRDRGGVW
jgi:hypothetical protein